MKPARVNVLGVGISAINMGTALASIDDWIARREQHYVCVTTVHGVMACQSDPELRQIFNRSGLTTPDGMPLVWLNWLGGQRHVGRVYGPDLMLTLCESSRLRGYRHFLYGGVEGVAETLAARLTERFPGLKIVGTYTPPFRPLTAEEDARVVEMINDASPDVVWVGISTPKQERWMAAHVGHLSAPVMIGVGAAFDFHIGRVRQAPGWMQGVGLEWLFRLSQEPRRLWRRYLLNNPVFVASVLLQMSRIKTYSLP
jgi:N-acetylglucosaminyldiphosphoundecaprenol N-acetyl-beta-D-mannosaminyltransferase